MSIKVVFHIDEVEKWDLLLGNVHNLLNGIDKEHSIVEVVANSKAVTGYQKTGQFKEKMEALQGMGVLFCACNNALKGMHMEAQDIFEFVNIVPIGVKELIEKQQEGFAYIKP